jgi:hypothetical protein
LATGILPFDEHANGASGRFRPDTLRSGEVV